MLKRCYRCKERFNLEQLCSDPRLYGNRIYCLPCLIETIVENVVVCYKCHARFVFPFKEKPGRSIMECGACCAERAWGNVDFHRYRARVAGLEDTLTYEEWEETVQYFGGMCAYCGIKPFEVFEHFIPIEQGGGTVKGNCVPSCRSCDRKKAGHHPDHIAHKFPQDRFIRLRAYLQQFL